MLYINSFEVDMDLGLIVKSIFFNKYLVGILGIVCTYLCLDNCEKIFTFVKRWIKGVVNFFKNKLFLLLVLIAGVLFYVAVYVTDMRGQNTFSLWLIYLMPFICVLSLLTVYNDEISDYFERKHNLLSIILALISDLAFWLFPVFSFCILCMLADIYFADKLEIAVLAVSIFMILRQCWFLVQHCLELLRINKNMHSIKDKAVSFVYEIFHIIQTFALIYTLVFVIDHDAFKNVVTDSAFSIAFDMTYFSAMTLLTGNNVIEPHSTIAKAGVLVETFILTVYISIIIFGIIEGQKKED